MTILKYKGALTKSIFFLLILHDTKFILAGLSEDRASVAISY